MRIICILESIDRRAQMPNAQCPPTHSHHPTPAHTATGQQPASQEERWRTCLGTCRPKPPPRLPRRLAAAAHPMPPSGGAPPRSSRAPRWPARVSAGGNGWWLGQWGCCCVWLLVQIERGSSRLTIHPFVHPSTQSIRHIHTAHLMQPPKRPAPRPAGGMAPASVRAKTTAASIPAQPIDVCELICVTPCHVQCACMHTPSSFDTPYLIYT